MSEENLYCFTHEGVKRVTARHDRSDRSSPSSRKLISNECFSLEDIVRSSELWNLIDMDHYSKVPRVY